VRYELDPEVAAAGVPFLSVAYRLAPESQGTALAEDVYSAIAWLREHATQLGVVPDRIAVMGDSGGGSPAARALPSASAALGVHIADRVLGGDFRHWPVGPARIRLGRW
jgi:acetyl esterase/lipase